MNQKQIWDRHFSRRDTLKIIGSAAMAGAAGMGMPRSLFAAPGGKRPNIVFILTDDHRWDMMSVMGHPFLKTPHMDRIANEGVLFENAFVTTSLCSPSRASFLTGQYASVHGVKNNFSHWSENRNITFMQHLKGVGYDTAFIGKWHMPGGGLPQLPGVDLFVSFTRKDGQGDYWDCPLFVNHQPVAPRTPYITEELTDYALDFLGKDRDNPFCLYLSHKAVHHDWRPPAHLKGKFKDVDLTGIFAPESDKYNTWTNLNWLEGTMGNMHAIYRRYCECLTSVDEQMGRVFDLLEKKGILDDTIVVYCGDNGYLWGEHRLYAKHYPYEESIRIPYMVRAPRFINNPGRRADQMILNLDLAPSLLEMAGVGIPDEMQGESFLPILQSPGTPSRESWVYELFRDFPFGGRVPPHKALRTQRHKYIEYELCQPPEIYDLQTDPRELKNLFGTPAGETLLPALQAELQRMKMQYHLAGG